MDVAVPRPSTGVGLLGPVLANALIVPLYLPLLVKGLGLYKIPLLGVDLEGRWLPMYLFGFVTVAIGQAVVMYGLGLPLLLALRRLGLQDLLGVRDGSSMNRSWGIVRVRLVDNESRAERAPSAPDEFLIVRDAEQLPFVLELRAPLPGAGHPRRPRAAGDHRVPLREVRRLRVWSAATRATSPETTSTGCVRCSRATGGWSRSWRASTSLRSIPMTAAEIEFALEEAGFDSVETTVLGEELVAAAYEQVRAHAPEAIPRLRSTCPVVVSWVERFHPQLTGALVTIVPPYIAQARLVKATSAENTAVVYVSPCWARKDEIFETQLAGAVDVAIGFDELKSLLAEEPARRRSPSKDPVVMRRPHAAKELSLTDGFPRRFLAERDMTSPRRRHRARADRDRPAAHGDRARRDRTERRGPAELRGLHRRARRQHRAVGVREAQRDRRRERAAAATARSTAGPSSRALPAIELRRSFKPAPVLSRVPSAEEIDAVLAEGEFYSRAEVLDCGACGHPTCVAHAAAVCLGDSSWDLCFPLQRKLLRARTRRDGRQALQATR